MNHHPISDAEIGIPYDKPHYVLINECFTSTEAIFYAARNNATPTSEPKAFLSEWGWPTAFNPAPAGLSDDGDVVSLMHGPVRGDKCRRPYTPPINKFDFLINYLITFFNKLINFF